MPRFGATLFLPGRAPALDELAVLRPRASVRRGALVVNDDTETLVTWTIEDLDVGGVFDATQPTRLIVPPGQGGLWLVTAAAHFLTDGAGVGTRELYIGASGGVPGLITGSSAPADAARPSRLTAAGLMQLSAGHTIFAFLRQNSGFNITCNFAMLQAARLN